MFIDYWYFKDFPSIRFASRGKHKYTIPRPSDNNKIHHGDIKEIKHFTQRDGKKEIEKRIIKQVEIKIKTKKKLIKAKESERI